MLQVIAIRDKKVYFLITKERRNDVHQLKPIRVLDTFTKSGFNVERTLVEINDHREPIFILHLDKSYQEQEYFVGQTFAEIFDAAMAARRVKPREAFTSKEIKEEIKKVRYNGGFINGYNIYTR